MRREQHYPRAATARGENASRRMRMAKKAAKKAAKKKMGK
jgi:hypothetical protein